MDQNTLLIIGLAGGVAAIGCAILCLITLLSLRSGQRERRELYKEMYGILKKIEGLTASRREQMIRHYDSILDNLANRLPPTVAAQTSDLIIDTEGKILARLAELEPNLREDDAARKKMEDLVRSMEKLEHAIVAITSDTVRQVLNDSRRELFEDQISKQSSLAA